MKTIGFFPAKNNDLLPHEPIGILGGIFNPVHAGHLSVAALARDFFKLDKVYFVPSGNPPHKASSDIASADHRLAMLARAIKGSNGFSIWDKELTRKGFSYSVDTVDCIRKENPGRSLYFIIGSDNLHEILTWHKYQDLLKAVTLCVAHRPRYSMKIPKELAKCEIRLFPSPEWSISSTKIRHYLKQGLSCEHLVPPAVAAYITRHSIYR